MKLGGLSKWTSETFRWSRCLHRTRIQSTTTVLPGSLMHSNLRAYDCFFRKKSYPLIQDDLKMRTWISSAPLQIYSSLNALTGLADAARTTWKPTVINVMVKASNADTMKVTHSPESWIRYAKFWSQASVKYHAAGKASSIPMPTSAKNSRDMSTTKPLTLAPITFRTPISL